MAQEFSFDVVSQVDLQEVLNAVQQAYTEMATRCDLRAPNTQIDLYEKAHRTHRTSAAEGSDD